MLRADRTPANRLSSVSALSGNTLFDVGIPTEVVGSLPRPKYLEDACAKYENGGISRDELESHHSRAVQETIQRMSQTGETVLTDGGYRSYPAAVYPIADTLTASDLPDSLFSDEQYFAICDEHERQLPRLIKGPFRYKTYAYESLRKTMALAEGHPMKATVVSPSMLYLLYPNKGTIPGYSREAFMQDLVDECEKDIRGCFDAGAQRVSIDFTERPLVAKRDLRTYQDNLPLFVSLLQRVVERFNAADRTNIGIHVCPSSSSPSTPPTPLSPTFPGLTPFSHHLLPAYLRLLPSLFEVPAGYFLLQLSSATPVDRTQIHKLIGEHIQRDANGVKQVTFLGVTDPQSPIIETPGQIADTLVEAAKWIAPDQLGATDDLGFLEHVEDNSLIGQAQAKAKGIGKEIAPQSLDGPDLARAVAFQKITSRVLGARLASERLGMTANYDGERFN